jgi:hypothetical protein
VVGCALDFTGRNLRDQSPTTAHNLHRRTAKRISRTGAGRAAKLANPAPVHGGTASMSVTATTWQAASFYHSDYSLAGLYQFFLLGPRRQYWRAALAGLFQLSGQHQRSGGLLPRRSARQYVAAIHHPAEFARRGRGHQSATASISSSPAPARAGTFTSTTFSSILCPFQRVVNVSVNATQAVRTVDERHFGINLTMWDDLFRSAQSHQDDWASCRRWARRWCACPGARSRINIIGPRTPRSPTPGNGQTSFNEHGARRHQRRRTGVHRGELRQRHAPGSGGLGAACEHHQSISATSIGRSATNVTAPGKPTPTRCPIMLIPTPGALPITSRR